MINAFTSYTREYFREYVKRFTVTVYNESWHCYVDFCDELKESCKLHNVAYSEKAISNYISKKISIYNAPCIHEAKFNPIQTGMCINPRTFTNLDELSNYWIERCMPTIKEWHYKVKCWDWAKEHHMYKSHFCDLDFFIMYENHIESLEDYENFKKGQIKRFKDNANPHAPIREFTHREICEAILKSLPYT